MDISLVVIVIIVANALISFQGFNNYSFFERYKFQIGAIQRGEKDRMFTSGFLHVDPGHLIFNMITLYFFGDVVVNNFGSGLFIVIYLVSLVSGSLLALYFHKDEYHYSAVGASGAVMGILYSAILLYPEMNLRFFFIPIDIPGYIFGIGYLLYTIYGMKARHDNVGHTTHFGGAIGGYVLTLAFEPNLFFTELRMVILLAIPILILFYMIKTGKI
ncbi:Membrane associated serine protease, rhomboid family [Pustulibacterium marinum]|uniref:Membrane associated serine protease, rhomboid family n=1 Tax=Pustulibacterium marinum TaxID=1224947 RepID=A0A1I7ICW3_9FLAO|nr:rhomboid family intramembrane serine protease [Pustulibacterium marinum]SFU70785.1 Membrane associated serine protease, rhomboid family [Pustulibacterium marinum]